MATLSSLHAHMQKDTRARLGKRQANMHTHTQPSIMELVLPV